MGYVEPRKTWFQNATMLLRKPQRVVEKARQEEGRAAEPYHTMQGNPEDYDLCLLTVPRVSRAADLLSRLAVDLLSRVP